MTPDDLGEVIVEFVRRGAWLKCSAVHAATGIEASAVGPADQGAQLERIALAKLRRLLAAPRPQDVVGPGVKA